MSRIRFDHVTQAKRPGLWVVPSERSLLAVVVVLWKVNQVLVRLWARVMEICPQGWMDIPLFSRLV
jgi:hypothetical protein